MGDHHHVVAFPGGRYQMTVYHQDIQHLLPSQLKGVLKGVFRQVSVKHLGRYLAEVMWRHNHRSSRVLDQMGSVVRNMDGRRLREMRAGGKSVRLADLERDERMPVQGELFSLAA